MEVLKIMSRKNNSVVKLVKINGKEVVVKYYQHHSRSMFIELNIMATCKHNNIIALLYLKKEDIHDPIRIVMKKEEKNYLEILENDELSTVDKIDYLLQIANAIRYLHHNHILHLDLKSENIMVTKKICKVIDFGSAEYIFGNKIYTHQSKCTVTHRPPEAFVTANNIFEFDYSFDIWSFGIIIFETFSGTPMYMHKFVPKYHSDNNILYDSEMHKFIMSINFSNEICKVVPEELRSCLNYNPNFRPRIEEIILILFSLRNKICIQVPVLTLDINLDLNIPLFDNTNYYIESYSYCKKIIKTISNNYIMMSQFYPNQIVYATYDLIYRLCVLFNTQNLDKKYIDCAIMLCHNFCNNSNTFSLEKIISLSRNKKQILDEIIMATRGILFQYNYAYDHNYKPPIDHIFDKNKFVQKLKIKHSIKL